MHLVERQVVPDQEVFVPLSIVLAVGLDPSLLSTQRSTWKSEGYIVRLAASTRDAFGLFRAGDFDMVLLGNFMFAEDRDRLALLIRAFGSLVPVIYIESSSDNRAALADATFGSEPSELLMGMRKLSAKKARMQAVQTLVSAPVQN
jgi:hypothetical protein